MKRVFFILFFVYGYSNAQIVNIPDENFKWRLTTTFVNNIAYDSNMNSIIVDANSDGQIQLSEALVVHYLYLTTGPTITDLTGLESFTNLKTLHCDNQELVGLNLSTLVNLENLNCNFSQLNSLDLTGLVHLKSLKCTGNPITSLTVALPEITYIEANNCTIGALSVTGSPNLETLHCSYNELLELDLTGLSKLSYLTCWNNYLTSLDFSDSPDFNSLICPDNPFLETLNFKGTSLIMNNFLGFDLCPNLTYICADDDDMPALQQLVDTYGYDDCVIGTYCSFNPGGNYNTITGKLLFDLNANGCGIDDMPQELIKMTINDGTTSGATFTDVSGNYTFYTQSGNFTITPQLENPDYFTILPSNPAISFPTVDNATVLQDFCVSANGFHPDLQIVIAPIVPARPGFDAVYKVVYQNKGNQIASGSLTFGYDETLLDFLSSTPMQSTSVSGLLTYDYANLMPFENREVIITLNVNSPTETPAVNIGDILVFDAGIVLNSATDEVPIDNIFAFNQTVVGAYDPNDKQCIEGNMVGTDKIGEYLHYLIRFENTGNFYAENIVVKDVINTAQFDINSLRVLNSSHPVTVRVHNNIAEFIFENINLDSGGHGNILLKVKTLETLAVGTTVTNEADIFFDYNFPIITNEAQTTFQTLGIKDNIVDSSVVLYPNPTTSKIQIQADSTIQSLSLYDLQGRILMTRMTSQQSDTLDLSDYPSGIYFLRVLTHNGSKTEKLIKK